MSKLEACYLANVVLYLPSLKDVIELKYVNKKCQEATLMIRYYDWEVRENMIDIFPNIETIHCGSDTLKGNEEIANKIKMIELTDCPNELSEDIRKKVIKLTYKKGNYKLIDFPNCREVVYKDTSSLNEFLGETSIHLKKLKVFFKHVRWDKKTIYGLKEFKNIKKIIVYFSDYDWYHENYEYVDFKKMISELKSFATVVSNIYLKGVDKNEYYLDVNRDVKMYNIYCCKIPSSTYEDYLFTCCDCEGDRANLRNCWYLTNISFGIDDDFLDGANSELGELRIEGCNHLKNLCCCYAYFDTIPSSVTSFYCSEWKAIKRYIEDFKYSHPNDEDPFKGIVERDFPEEFEESE